MKTKLNVIASLSILLSVWFVSGYSTRVDASGEGNVSIVTLRIEGMT